MMENKNVDGLLMEVERMSDMHYTMLMNYLLYDVMYYIKQVQEAAIGR